MRPITLLNVQLSSGARPDLGGHKHRYMLRNATPGDIRRRESARGYKAGTGAVRTGVFHVIVLRQECASRIGTRDTTLGLVDCWSQ